MSMHHDHENEVIYFGKTNFRNQMTKFGIKTDDRRRHVYVIGKTGMGKTTLLENFILSDIYAGHGCCYVDPHGDTAEKLLNYIPSWRINDVVYFNPSDLEFPVGFNILEAVSERHKHLVASGMMAVFAKIWEGMWSSRMEYILNNTILALLDNQGQTLLGINRMMSDAEYRKRMVGNIKDPVVKQFWVVEFASWSEKYATEATAAIQNKIGQFLSAGVIRNIVSQVKSTVNIREIMDQEKIFIVNLSKGRIGEDNSKLLGGLLITKIQLSAMERVDTPEADRDDFYLYVDEFQNFAVESFANILSEARKYRLCLIMAHQYIAQLSEEVRDAVFGNVGTIITFRVGSPDAMFMETEFMPRFLPEDIINLPKFNIYLKLLIDGVTSMPFSAATLAPIAQVTNSQERVVKISRERYSMPRAQIEENIMTWSGMGEANIEEMYKAADVKKNAAKQGGKPRHEYDCSRCSSLVVLPVELDRSRPIYCDDCIKIVRDEKKSGKKPSKPVRVTPKTQAPAATAPPAPADTSVIEKPAAKETVGLDALSTKPKKPVETQATEAPEPVKSTGPKKELWKKSVEKKARPSSPPAPKPEVHVEKETAEVKVSPTPTPEAPKVPVIAQVPESTTAVSDPIVPAPKPAPATGGPSLDLAALSKKKTEKKEQNKAPRGESESYTCHECSTDFTTDIKLDRTRAVRCETCLKKLREDRKKEKAVTKPTDRGDDPGSEPKKRKRKRKKRAPELSADKPVTSVKTPASPQVHKPKEAPAKKPPETKPPLFTKPPDTQPSQTGTLKSGQTVHFD